MFFSLYFLSFSVLTLYDLSFYTFCVVIHFCLFLRFVFICLVFIHFLFIRFVIIRFVIICFVVICFVTESSSSIWKKALPPVAHIRFTLEQSSFHSAGDTVSSNQEHSSLNSYPDINSTWDSEFDPPAIACPTWNVTLSRSNPFPRTIESPPFVTRAKSYMVRNQAPVILTQALFCQAARSYCPGPNWAVPGTPQGLWTWRPCGQLRRNPQFGDSGQRCPPGGWRLHLCIFKK